jgi:exonuclease SbcC
MAVEMEFAVGGQRYRVARHYNRRRGQTTCILQAADNGCFYNLAEGVRQVEAGLARLLRLDHDTFVNSAFLRQGKADEFTLKRPAEKRQVLADILGMSYFSRLEDRAKEHAREEARERVRLEIELEHIAAELALIPQYKTELNKAYQRLGDTEAALQAAIALDQETQQKLVDTEQQVGRLRYMEAAIEGMLKDTAFWQSQAAEQRCQADAYQTLQGRSAEIEEGYRSLSRAREQDEELGRNLLEFTGEDSRRISLKSALDNARLDLEREQRSVSQKLVELEENAARLPALEDSLTKAQVGLEGLRGEVVRLEALRSEAEALSQHLAVIETEGVQQKKELDDLKEKGHLLSQEQARCPLCGAELGEAGVLDLRSVYQEETGSREERITALRQEHTTTSHKLTALRLEVSRQEKALEQGREQAQAQIGLLSNKAAEAAAALHEAAVIKETSSVIATRLLGDDFSHQERHELAESEARIANIGYDAEQHEEVRRQREVLKGFDAEMRQLQEARDRLPSTRQAEQRATQAAAQKETEAAGLKCEVAALHPVVEALPHLYREAEVCTVEVNRLSVERDASRSRQAVLNDRLVRLEQQEREQANRTVQREQAAREEAIYNRLAEAFGKKGVQALLVEAALPELEEEADALLSRLTQGRMALRFVTQDEHGREILDIHISDELGTRSYEMYSGGETFRINFSLRVALSKLLARRSGSPMRLLIVDEGFGTQDSVGRERLIEAINAISPEFDTIIAVTHLDELKALFPVRIEFTKTPEGSTIAVNM